jgi:hypothetical protein
VSDRRNCRCATALAAGTVIVPPYPPANGPRVSVVDAVVLVVRVPVAVVVTVGVGVAVGGVVPVLNAGAVAAPPLQPVTKPAAETTRTQSAGRSRMTTLPVKNG